MSREQREKKIVDSWAQHKGMLDEEAMMEYLKLAQELDMYGITYFDIRNRSGTELWLGVSASGVSIYKKENT